MQKDTGDDKCLAKTQDHYHLMPADGGNQCFFSSSARTTPLFFEERLISLVEEEKKKETFVDLTDNPAGLLALKIGQSGIYGGVLWTRLKDAEGSRMYQMSGLNTMAAINSNSDGVKLVYAPNGGVPTEKPFSMDCKIYGRRSIWRSDFFLLGDFGSDRLYAKLVTVGHQAYKLFKTGTGLEPDDSEFGHSHALCYLSSTKEKYTFFSKDNEKITLIAQKIDTVDGENIFAVPHATLMPNTWHGALNVSNLSRPLNNNVLMGIIGWSDNFTVSHAHIHLGIFPMKPFWKMVFKIGCQFARVCPYVAMSMAVIAVAYRNW